MSVHWLGRDGRAVIVTGCLVETELKDHLMVTRGCDTARGDAEPETTRFGYPSLERAQQRSIARAATNDVIREPHSVEAVLGGDRRELMLLVDIRDNHARTRFPE